MKNICRIIAIFLLLFAIVQYNDPDPWLWILVYGGTAVHFALAAQNRLYRPALWVWTIGATVWAATLAPEFVAWLRMGAPSIVETMKAQKPWVELTREFLGLVLVVACCAWLLRKTRKKS
jgi:Transmembrane family 220, helix